LLSQIAQSGDSMVTWSQQLTSAAIHAGIAVAIALALHLGLFALLDRAARLSASKADDILFDRLRQPLRWSMVAVGIALAGEADALVARGWDMVGRFIVPLLLGWTVFALVKAFAAAMMARAEAGDNDEIARSRQTRIAILSRTAGFLIIFVTIALMLFAIPAVRAIGTTLLASAGLATLVVGAAAQPALRSLIAGMQIALTEPIRIGDYVVIEGESGRVEDIRLSYVVIRTGDERRLIVPTVKFLDGTFQNWTRVGGGITGSVVLRIKPGFPLDPIRAAYEQLLAASKDWDKRTGSLHVSEIEVGHIEIKLVMSAKGPTALNRLRPAMREAMLEWLRENMTEALCDEV
jgi:small-conductance mechanosensitive channel